MPHAHASQPIKRAQAELFLSLRFDFSSSSFFRLNGEDWGLGTEDCGTTDCGTEERGSTTIEKLRRTQV